MALHQELSRLRKEIFRLCLESVESLHISYQESSCVSSLSRSCSWSTASYAERTSGGIYGRQRRERETYIARSRAGGNEERAVQRTPCACHLPSGWMGRHQRRGV